MATRDPQRRRGRRAEIDDTGLRRGGVRLHAPGLHSVRLRGLLGDGPLRRDRAEDPAVRGRVSRPPRRPPTAASRVLLDDLLQADAGEPTSSALDRLRRRRFEDCRSSKVLVDRRESTPLLRQKVDLPRRSGAPSPSPASKIDEPYGPAGPSLRSLPAASPKRSLTAPLQTAGASRYLAADASLSRAAPTRVGASIASARLPSSADGESGESSC